MPSRLKGIETLVLFYLCFYFLNFGYAFPFEGNWNAATFAAVSSPVRLWICLPVWRELKHSDVTLHNYMFRKLWICLPVWRELKRIRSAIIITRIKRLWICLPVWRELKPFWSTQQRKFFALCYFGYAFPFEGNWNINLFSWCWLLNFILWICLPVWRELKLKALNMEFYFHRDKLWICLPVWRELKPFCSCFAEVIVYFGYAFPFEGNWNCVAVDQSHFSHAFGYAFPFEGNWNYKEQMIFLVD